MDTLRQSHLSDVRLLLAEDNVYALKMILNVLRAFGFRDIYDAQNGADALELFWCKQVDLVITDHFMPMYTGADLSRHIRTNDKSPNPYVPIVAVTPGTTRHVVEELRDSGVNEIVAKPFTPKDLLAKINATIFKPRAFVKTATYFGPDRRRRAMSNYDGAERRQCELEKAVANAATAGPTPTSTEPANSTETAASPATKHEPTLIPNEKQEPTLIPEERPAPNLTNA